MELKPQNIFGAAVAVAVGALTFESVKENYDTIKDKFSAAGKKVVDEIKRDSKDQEVVKGGNDND